MPYISGAVACTKEHVVADSVRSATRSAHACQPLISTIHVTLLGQPIKHDTVCVDCWRQTTCRHSVNPLHSTVPVTGFDASMDNHVIAYGIGLNAFLFHAAKPCLCPRLVAGLCASMQHRTEADHIRFGIRTCASVPTKTLHGLRFLIEHAH